MLDIDHSEGRELDEFVHGIGFKNEIYSQEYMLEMAEEVWKDQPYCEYFNAGFSKVRSDENVFEQHIPNYSADANKAIEILDKIKQNVNDVRITVTKTYYRIYLTKYIQDEFGNDIGVENYYAGAKELSTAICRVFLKTFLGYIE